MCRVVWAVSSNMARSNMARSNMAYIYYISIIWRRAGKIYVGGLQHCGSFLIVSRPVTERSKPYLDLSNIREH